MKKHPIILLFIGMAMAAKAAFLINGDFNTGDLSGWSSTIPEPATQSISIEEACTHDGSPCAKMASATDGSWQSLKQTFSCSENTAYLLSFVYNAPQWAGAGVSIKYFDSDSNYLDDTWVSMANTLDWTYWEGNFKTPAGAAYTEVGFSEGGWGTMNIDNIDVSLNAGLKGADVSTVVRQEDQGVNYHENGVQKDPLVILKNHDIALASIRLFVDPAMSDEGASMDLSYVTSLAARCKDAGLQVLLSLHYSDTWTDPGTQNKPAAWEGLTHEQLVTRVSDYTYDVVSAVQPEFTKIGNETSCGMLWPEGNVCDGNWDNFRAYVTAAHNAAKAAHPGTITLVHVSQTSSEACQWFFDNLLAGSVSFDRIGLSLYPEWHGDMANMTAIHSQASKYGKRVMIVEMADYYAGVEGKSEATQKQFVEDMLALNPEAIYWEPLWFRGSVGYRSLFKQLYPGSDDWFNCEMTEGLSGFDSPWPPVLIKLGFNQSSGSSVGNTGTVSATFTKATPPDWSANVPMNGGAGSLDFGTSTGNYYVESGSIISELAGLTGFTVTGWVNNRSSAMGPGGNRIVSWIKNGGNGVDIVYKSDGALQVGINQWPDGSVALSSSGKIPTDATAPGSNWRFFAVTYESSTGSLKFYFGDNTTPASLDKTITYSRGAVGSDIGKLAVGHFNAESSRTSRTNRMFRGLIDQIEIHGSELPLPEIQLVQNIGVTVPVTGVSVSPATASLDAGAAIQLTATVEPSNAANQNVSWNSSDAAVATVNTSGLVTGVAEGSAVITATTEDGGFTATCDVTISPLVVPVTGVNVLPVAASISVGGTTQLAAMVEPSDATDQNVSWSTSDAAIATVNTSGLITGVAEGTAVITVTTDDGGYTAACDVTVSDEAVPVTGISVSPTTVSLDAGTTVQLTAAVAPSNATNQGISWHSSDTAVAKVNSSTGMRNITSLELTADMGAGWNLGNSLDAYGDWVSGLETETCWGNPKTTKAMIDAIKLKGFKTIRMPVTWHQHLGDAPDYTIDGEWLDRVEEVANYALANNMYVIINIHHDDSWVVPTYAKQDDVTDQLTKVWTQIADRFKDYGDYLIFETLNEPRLVGSPEEYTGGTEEGRDVVNAFHLAAVNAIRNTGGNNIGRHILISPYGANGGNDAINDLVIPNDDDRIIISWHNYFPYNFVMQIPGTDTWGSSSEQSALLAEFDRLYNKFIVNGRAVIIGEWAPTDKDNTLERVHYTEFFVKAATERKMVPIWWDNGDLIGGDTGGGSGIFNRNTLEWHYPAIADAIVNNTINLSVLVTGVAEGTAVITVTTADGGYTATCNVTVAESTLPAPLISLGFNENSGSSVGNTGTASATFTKTTPPDWSSNVPVNGGASSVDFGTSIGNYYVESESIIGELAGLTGFTVTGWVNNRNSSVGSGGNRIVSWIRNGGNGVDIVYNSDGSLKLGINQWPDVSNAKSNSDQIPTDAGAGESNWRFFAVTYESSSGSVKFYFGDNATPASLDKIITYNQGAVGPDIGKLAVGHFNAESSRTSRTNRMFRGLIDHVEVYGAVLSLAEVQTAQNLAPTVTYTLATSVTGQGSVNPDSGTYEEGSSVELTATPDTGWVFDSWSGDVTGTANPVTITMDSNKSVTANFSQIPTYDLTTSVMGQGSVSPDSGTFEEGSLVELTATPAAGWQFDGWSGDAVGMDNPVTIIIDSDKSVTATFSEVPTYDLATSVIGQGTVSPDSGTYNEGSSVELTATPAAGWQFDGWSGDASGTTNPITITMDANKSVTASFSEILYTLTTSVIGQGSVSPDSGTYNEGSQVELTAIPAAGWQFDGWSGDASGTTNPETITMDSDKSVTATFSEITYNLTTSVTGQGSVSPSSGTYAEGDSVELTATPAAGWQFEGWSGDVTGTTNPVTVTMDSDKSVTATFSQITYNLTTSVIGQGSVGPSSGTYAAGASVELTATPPTGWAFDGWSGDVVGMDNPVTIIMDSDKSVTAYFIEIPTHDLTTSVVGQGSVSPSSGTYEQGSSVELTATPASGWVFDGWSGDATGSTNPLSITMGADKFITATFIESPLPPALVRLGFNENSGSSVGNVGTVSATFTKTTPPDWSANVPVNGGASSVDFGTSIGNYYVESESIISELAGLTGFTVTGWVNNRNSSVGSGGNRIVSWIRNGGNGVDIVYKSDGALQVGINQWPDRSSALSSSGQIPTDAAAPESNWRFFAVTYESSTGSLNFYFGDNTTPASLDKTISYSQGAVGNDIGKLAIGHFNEESSRTSRTNRMFRGLIDHVEVYGTVLSLSEIQTAQNLVPSVTFELTTSVTGQGSISPGSGTYIEGTSVELTAAPASGWTFDGWSGDVTGTTNPVTITMDSDKSVTANFSEIPTYTLTTSVSGLGSVSPSSGTYEEGSSVEITATPALGWAFDGWSGDVTGTTNPATITMDADKSVTATFSEIPTYDMTTSVTGQGSVSPSNGTYNEGSSVELMANPATGWQFDGWSGDVTGTTNPVTIVMDADKSVTATFIEIPTYNLTTSVSGQGSVSPGSGTYEHGSSVELLATPALGWVFDSWSGDASGATNPLNITMDADKSITATFIESPLPPALIRLEFNENSGSSVGNTGTVSATFTKTAPPDWSTNVPVNGGVSSVDFGTNIGNYYVESESIIGELAGLTDFTVTGWVNNRNSSVGSGGNRIISWIKNGGNGVDIVYKSDGALQVGINQWPDRSIALSSSGKIPTDAGATESNWRFFAVTYESSTGSLKFYFGDNTTAASLDKTISYRQGAVGTDIGKLAVGHFNSESKRTSRTNRMFRGLIDQVVVYSTALSLAEIQTAQNIAGP